MKPSTFNRRLAKLLAQSPQGYVGAILFEEGCSLRSGGVIERDEGVDVFGSLILSPSRVSGLEVNGLSLKNFARKVLKPRIQELAAEIEKDFMETIPTTPVS